MNAKSGVVFGFGFAVGTIIAAMIVAFAMGALRGKR